MPTDLTTPDLPQGNLVPSAWDAYFRTIVTAGWANESDGEVEAPTGHFAEVTIERGDLPEFRDLFDDDADPLIRAWMVTGHFLVMENSDGIVHVYSYATKSDVRIAFDYLANKFAEWVENVRLAEVLADEEASYES